MIWMRLQRLRLWLAGALWLIPLLGVAVAFLLQEVSIPFDEAISGQDVALGLLSPSAADTLLAAIGGGMVTFTGFVFSVVLLIVQFGSSQYSPRTVSYFLHAKTIWVVLAVFLTTIVFSFLSVIEVGSGRRDQYVPLGSVAMSIVLLVASLTSFLVLLHVVGNKIRVDTVLSDLGQHARTRLARRAAGRPSSARPCAADALRAENATTIDFTGRPGQVVAVNAARLTRLARRRRARIILQVQVGDALTTGTDVALVVGGSPVRPRELSRCLLVDDERSLRLDPLYALRILTDISLRALSPAINDPTTATRALDEVEGVLRAASALPLGPIEVPAGPGAVVLRSPTWQDFLDVALLEVCDAGAGQPQVSRRLMALLGDLARELPVERRRAIHPYLDLLVDRVRSTVPAALQQASLIPDLQGIGGANQNG